MIDCFHIYFYEIRKVKDATPAIFIVITFFIFPMKWGWTKFFCRGRNQKLPTKNSPALITWKFINAKVPWSLIFLLGGGFALAEGGKVTGMNSLIGKSLAQFGTLPPLLLLFCVCLTAGTLTEFTSNVAVANIMLPVLAEMALQIQIHPLLLMYPAALMCSMAFHMPVGTPPNAIAAEYTNIAMKDMVVDLLIALQINIFNNIFFIYHRQLLVLVQAYSRF